MAICFKACLYQRLGVFFVNNIILIDWFSFTTTIHSVNSIIEFLGLGEIKDFIKTYGSRGFRDRITYSGLNIHFNNSQDENLIWVEFTGQGCRLFEELSKKEWEDIFFTILDEQENYNVTRLDIAYDDWQGVLNIDKIYSETLKENFVSRFRTWSCINSNKGITVYLGSVQSAIRFTFYDKAKEREREDIEHWVRLEIRMRDENALEFIKNLNNYTVGDLFFCVVNNYLRYVKPSKTDSNKQRWNTRGWWLKFINTTKKISLWTKCDREYNLARCEDYVYRQCGNALDTLINIKGVERLLDELEKNKPSEKNIKYIKLEKEYKANEGILNYLEERNAL